jgi:ArsR family transcriptional regulator, arsenate/arsenite/antimonite-responsive transcriptional repressor
LAELLEILKALGDETRFKLLTLLVSHDYCVGALAKRLNISESAVSQHLRILRNAGIVRGDKRGYYTHYWVDREVLKIAASEINELSDKKPVKNECNKHKSMNNSCCRKEEGEDVKR